MKTKNLERLLSLTSIIFVIEFLLLIALIIYKVVFPEFASFGKFILLVLSISVTYCIGSFISLKISNHESKK
jgi:ABC-type multidrug transport system permease subunit